MEPKAQRGQSYIASLSQKWVIYCLWLSVYNNRYNVWSSQPYKNNAYCGKKLKTTTGSLKEHLKKEKKNQQLDDTKYII